MNYLWELMLQLKKQEVPEKSIRFQMPHEFSTYMELSSPYLNQKEVEEGAAVEINPYYRFYNIFKDFFQPDLKEFPKLRENLFHLIFHQLMQNDALSGMTREEYHKKLLYRDFTEHAFGTLASEAITLFNRDERETVLSGLLKQYETGSSLDLFKDMMEALIPNNIVYHSNQNSFEILVYIGVKKDKVIVEKMDFLIKMFVELPYHVDIYYEYHFGIMGMEETMLMDEIILC
ncbi:hypothetical protein [Clostridium sp. Marseille-P2415]|uniref:hypothetical protein n=1 Tax=Clostridium sp. Marseille-P2415 TaxID=1805471 RepID=UPI0009886F89|nr:hypothetical protein [Clostridium sp. Marseille-P2415]